MGDKIMPHTSQDQENAREIYAELKEKLEKGEIKEIPCDYML
jgi:hypothetical protein